MKSIKVVCLVVSRHEGLFWEENGEVLVHLKSQTGKHSRVRRSVGKAEASGISPSEKDKYHMNSLICGI